MSWILKVYSLSEEGHDGCRPAIEKSTSCGSSPTMVDHSRNVFEQPF